jgi:hypothetical protein
MPPRIRSKKIEKTRSQIEKPQTQGNLIMSPSSNRKRRRENLAERGYETDPSMRRKEKGTWRDGGRELRVGQREAARYARQRRETPDGVVDEEEVAEGEESSRFGSGTRW